MTAAVLMPTRRLPQLKTARLRLRPLTPLDAESLRAAIDDVEVSKWLSVVPHPYTLDDALWFIGHAADSGAQVWVIDDGRLSGIIGLGDEFGYWIARDRWGRGYATEATRAVLRWHFGDGPGDDVTAGHFLDNAASARVLAKLGFRPAGPRRIPCRARGQDMDSMGMRLTRADWQAAARA